MNRGMITTILVTLGFVIIGCSAEAQETRDSNDPAGHIITFVELGSVNCIPCKKMQPVMDSIERKYGGQIKVVFHDVWKPEQKHFASEYGIKLIPTQVFLDSTGKELLRHEGFFPEAEIDSFLVSQGLITQHSAD